jgi:hypothetical protein
MQDIDRSGALSGGAAGDNELLCRVKTELGRLEGYNVDVSMFRAKLVQAEHLRSEGDSDRADSVLSEVLARSRALWEIVSITVGVVKKMTAAGGADGGPIGMEELASSVSRSILESGEFSLKVAEIAHEVAPAVKKEIPPDAVEEVKKRVLASEDLRRLVASVASEAAPQNAHYPHPAEMMQFVMDQVVNSDSFRRRVNDVINAEMPDYKGFVREYTARAMGKLLFQTEFEARVRELAPRVKPAELVRTETEKVAARASEYAFADMLESKELNGLVVRIATAVSHEHHDRLSKTVVGELLSNIERVVAERFAKERETMGLSKNVLDKRIGEIAGSAVAMFMKTPEFQELLDIKFERMKSEVELEIMTRLASEFGGAGDANLREAVRSAADERVRLLMNSPEFDALLRGKERPAETPQVPQSAVKIEAAGAEVRAPDHPV